MVGQEDRRGTAERQDPCDRCHGVRSNPQGRERSARLGASAFSAFCPDRRLAHDAIRHLEHNPGAPVEPLVSPPLPLGSSRLVPAWMRMVASTAHELDAGLGRA